ncbi:hypothetical protein [Pseudomonas sp. MPFS]|uniref:hypothetical protein n=1 Tax=Pseudomonas sp. MPFS TaxID=2795724 RepID=UPI001F1424DB|nr:hypothetical protein [Pseudomonas sp. MPFS]
MHDPRKCSSPRTPKYLGSATIKGLLCTLIVLGLSGCVGAWVDMPEKQESTTVAYQQLVKNGTHPVITHTEKTSPQRRWCGTTIWAVILPIPLKLPVCESYDSAISYGNDAHGTPTPLLRSSQTLGSTFHACGPLMFMAPILHGYQGNALCGTFR